MNTSVNWEHAQCFYTTYQNETFHDQRVVYNMDVEFHLQSKTNLLNSSNCKYDRVHAVEDISMM